MLQASEETEPLTINQLFVVKKGKGGYRENLEVGKTPLVSATNKDNGIIDSVDLEPTFKAPAITVERVSGQAFVQLVDFATVPDDIFVLVPREPMSVKKLFHIAAQINLQKWRFNYSRKLISDRLKVLKIDLSSFSDGELHLQTRLPKAPSKSRIKHNTRYKEFSLKELFEPVGNGDYHVSSTMSRGDVAFVSCLTVNNGVLGYCDIPKDKTYENAMTITSDGDKPLTPYYHSYKFNAQDNVMIYRPKAGLSLEAIFFIMSQLRRMRWRFSYGRKCYKNKLTKIKFNLPIKDDGTIDTQYIKQLTSNCYGWDIVKSVFAKA